MTKEIEEEGKIADTDFQTHLAECDNLVESLQKTLACQTEKLEGIRALAKQNQEEDRRIIQSHRDMDDTLRDLNGRKADFAHNVSSANHAALMREFRVVRNLYYQEASNRRELSQKLRRLRHEADGQEETSKSDAAARIAALEKEVALYKGKYEKSAAEAAEYKDAVKALESTEVKLLGKHGEGETTVEKLTADLEMMKEQMAKMEADFQEERDQRDKKEAILKERVQTLDSSANAERRTSTALDETVAKTLKAAQDECEKLREELVLERSKNQGQKAGAETTDLAIQTDAEATPTPKSAAKVRPPAVQTEAADAEATTTPKSGAKVAKPPAVQTDAEATTSPKSGAKAVKPSPKSSLSPKSAKPAASTSPKTSSSSPSAANVPTLDIKNLSIDRCPSPTPDGFMTPASVASPEPSPRSALSSPRSARSTSPPPKKTPGAVPPAAARPVLGLEVTFVTEGSSDKATNTVAQLKAGGPAEKAGLKVGDTIVKWNGKEVPDRTTFDGLAAKVKPAEKIQMDITRDGKPHTVAIVASSGSATTGQKVVVKKKVVKKVVAAS
eukprot:NODE_252_length_1921_cov_158.105769_g202_i0.p1 GENE.NODE_252_length_1921_cov_158.105769_g202_i0~~NODE_252_length_1921_cov_158.105769_g202_i0.p1  ORF type:complete len:558 (-),score=157.10 NODE_252_length_1921_cov_158.105769_g202_i0:154-1827(-)